MFGRVVGVERLPEDLVEGLGARPELRGVGLTDRDRACYLQPLHDQGVVLRDEIGEDGGAEGRPDALREREVLVRHRKPVQRPDRQAAGYLLVGGSGPLHRLLRQERHYRVDLGVRGLDPR